MVVHNEWASGVLRGDQLAGELRRRGADAAVLRHDTLVDSPPHDSVVVFVKSFEPETVETVRAHGNLAVWSAVDAVAKDEDVEGLERFDAAIFASEAAREDRRPFLRPGAATIALPFHADPRWRPNHADAFRLAYLGTAARVWHGHRQLPDLHLEFVRTRQQDASVERFFERAQRYSCHLAVSESDTRDFRFKPNTKVVGAAASRANIVLSRTPAHEELLDPAYPYYIEDAEDEVEAVIAAVERARDGYGSAEWCRALEAIDEVRERTSLARVASEWRRFFESLG